MAPKFNYGVQKMARQRKDDLVYLSASRMKTIQLCSWQYFVKYILKVPDTSNDGSRRGSVCHGVLEHLVKPKHFDKYQKVIKAGSIEGCPVVERYVRKYLRILEGYSEENYEMCDSFILCGLRTDFFGEGGKVLDPEIYFELKDGKDYFALGYIDKVILYEKQKIVKIVDYKTSKSKFRGEELESNVQAMIYTLAAKQLWPDYTPVVEFIFLKFPKSPVQSLSFTDTELSGFERFISHFYNNILVGFDEKRGRNNFAIDGGFKTKWLCGPTKSGWECPVKNELTYYCLVDKDSKKILKSSFEPDIPIKPNTILEKRIYSGCPKFNDEIL